MQVLRNARFVTERRPSGGAVYGRGGPGLGRPSAPGRTEQRPGALDVVVARTYAALPADRGLVVPGPPAVSGYVLPDVFAAKRLDIRHQVALEVMNDRDRRAVGEECGVPGLAPVAGGVDHLP